MTSLFSVAVVSRSSWSLWRSGDILINNFLIILPEVVSFALYSFEQQQLETGLRWKSIDSCRNCGNLGDFLLFSVLYRIKLKIFVFWSYKTRRRWYKKTKQSIHLENKCLINDQLLRLSRQSMFSIFSIFQEFKNVSWLKFFRIKRSFSVSWTLYKHKQSCDCLLVMFVAIKQQDHQGYLNTEPDCNFCVWQLLLDRREGSSSGQHEHLQKKPTLGIFLNYSGSAPQLWTSVSLTGWNRLKAAV